MTTIAYKDGVIAYDSRMVRRNIIVDDDYNKKIIINDIIFFISGTTSDIDRLIDSYINDTKKDDVDAGAIIYDSGKLFRIGVDDDTKTIFKVPIRIDSIDAMGSGQEFAFTAMDMGATAAEAVKMAAKRDLYTNTNIKTFILPK